MKTTIKSILAIALNVMLLFSCKKADQMQPFDQNQLVNNQEFRNFVANDLLNRISLTFYFSQRINQAQRQSLKDELINTSDDQLSILFSKYKLSYTIFQESIIKQVYSKSRLFNQINSLNQLSDIEADQLIEKNYQIVSNDLMHKVKEVIKEKFILKNHNLAKNSGINTLSNNNEMTYFADGSETGFQDGFSESDAIYYIAQQIVNHGGNVSHGLTIDEVWNCAKSAVGLGTGAVLGIAGLKELAKKDIHAAVITTSRWLAKRAGWVGAVIVALDFSSCLYAESND